MIFSVILLLILGVYTWLRGHEWDDFGGMVLGPMAVGSAVVSLYYLALP